MELEDLKNIWKEDNQKLESRILINEKRLQNLDMKKNIGEFDKLISKSILGRNMALVYCLITLIMSSIVIEEFAYSIPAIIGSFALLWSFIDHLVIAKPDYSRISMVELQKSIFNFRIHTSSTAKYDIAIVLMWLITGTPLYLRLVHNTSIYSNPKHLAIFCLFSLVICILVIAMTRKTYSLYEQKLKEAESDLEKILEFENA